MKMTQQKRAVYDTQGGFVELKVFALVNYIGGSDGGDKSKIVNIGVCPFIRDKGDKYKSELCNF